MIITLNSAQMTKVSDLCMDLAKGLLLASFIAPSINSFITLIQVLKSTITGLLFVYISLTLISKTNKEGV